LAEQRRALCFCALQQYRARESALATVSSKDVPGTSIAISVMNVPANLSGYSNTPREMKMAQAVV
jgi:hypothetical protein